MNKYILIFTSLLTVLIFSCGTDEGEDPITYTNTVKQIIDTNCGTSFCHGEGAEIPSFEMHTYATLVAAVGFGKILDAINHDESNGVSPMPIGGAAKLPQQDIDDITTWINEGTVE